MRHIFYSVILFVCGSMSGQQNWMDLVEEDLTYGEILTNCESLFDNIGKGRGTGYKQYRRWRYVMDARASATDKLENYALRNYKAYEEAVRTAANSRATTGDWENIGPFDYTGFDTWSSAGMGRTNCTAFHPTNPDIFWVGAACGGMWVTADGGGTWSPRTDGFPSIGISSIVVHPVDPDTIYILTGDGDGGDSPSLGILKTVNGGMTWQPTGLYFSASESRRGYKMMMHPTNPQILFAAFRTVGLFKSTNGGISFTQEIGNDTTVWDFEIAPDDANKMYAATNKGFMRSVNGGSTWFVDGDSDFPATYDRMAIAISPAAATNVYVVFGGDTNVNGTFRGCFKSIDYGQNFSMQSSTPNILGWSMEGGDSTDQSGYDLAIIVDPNNDSRIFVGGVNIWKSENSGATWSRITWWRRDNEPFIPFVHADHHNFYFNDATLFVNNDGGLYTSTDLGGEWTELSAGLAIGQFYQINILNENYMGGLQDNGTMQSTMTNPQSHDIAGGDGFGCTWHSGDNSIQFLSSQDAIARRQFGSNVLIWEETDAFWHTEIEMHTTNPNYLFLIKGTELYRGHQDGAIWNFVWEDLNTDSIFGSAIQSFSQSVSNPNIMYAASLGGVIKTENLSAAIPTWQLLDDPTSVAVISDVEVDPTNPDRVWVSYGEYDAGQKVFYSDDGGDTWENISGSIQNVPIRCIAYTSGAYPGIYIGTEIGVYYRGNSMSDWVSFANLFPNTIVSDIEVQNGYVYAGTFGRGIWRSPIYSPCPVNLTLTPGNDPSSSYFTGTQSYYASNSIVSTRIVPGSIGNHVSYSAGFKTDLLLGFKAEAGSFFEVKSDGCPD